MRSSDRKVVTSAEFTRQFGHISKSLGNRPAFITHHGRETHVLLSASQFQELETVGQRANDGASRGLPAFQALAGWIQQGLIVLDIESRVIFANPAAHGIVNRPEGALAGRDLYAAIPELEGALLQLYLRRAMASGAPCSADVPSPCRPDAWLCAEVFPAAQGTTVLLRDITDDVRHHRLADARAAMMAALASHQGIGQMRINLDRTIATVDEVTCSFLGMPEARLRAVPLADLAPGDTRLALLAMLDVVLSDKGPVAFDTVLLGNDDRRFPARVAMAALRGVYGVEGVVMVLTGR